MKVTKLNFKYLYPKISKILRECDYIAIDLEFSGTASKKEHTNTKYDDVNLRYFKLKESTKNYLPLQFGLCGMKIKKDSQIQLYPMNFYIFPYVNENTSRKYSFDIGSINFLANNMFDFNKTFYDGVRYVSLKEFEKNKFIKIAEEEKKAKNKKKIFPPEARLFTISIYNSLKIFVENFVKNNLDFNSKENFFEFEINSIRKIMLEYFLANVNNLFQTDGKKVIFDVEVDETNMTKTLLKLKISNEKLLQEKLFSLENEKNLKKISSWIYYQSLAMIESDDEAHKILWNRILINLVFKNLKSENIELNTAIESYMNDVKNSENLENFSNELKKILTNNTAKINFTSPFYKELSKFILDMDNVDEYYKVGFTRIISDLIKNKKNLIFHNGILDLIHLIDKFIEPVPETYEEFTNTVNKYFPSVFDTKYIIENNSSLFSIFPQSSLELVYNKINSGECWEIEKMSELGDGLDIKIDEEIVGNEYRLNKMKKFDKKLDKKLENELATAKIFKNMDSENPISLLDESTPIPNTLSTRHLLNDENSSNIENIEIYQPVAVDVSNPSNNLFSLRSHEAGYDAMLTCYVFVFLYKFLTNNKNPFNDKNSFLLLDVFRNRMLFSGLQVSCDLNKKKAANAKEKSTGRFEIFVLLDLPEFITGEELKSNFKSSFGMSPIIYKLFGQNVAYAIFTKSWEREEFIKLKKEGEDNLILAKLYLQEYKKDSPIVSYSKYVSNIKCEMDIEKIIKELE